MATVEEIGELVGLADELGLENREVLREYRMEELREMFNGIGPEWFPEPLRRLLDSLHPSLRVVAFIHDVEWSASDGTRASFTESNERFKRNGYKVARARFAWYNPRRYVVMNQARRFANTCQLFGWSAWTASLRSLAALAISAFAAGCASQEIVSREYYPPTASTLMTRGDGMKMGALKSETVKTGSPDWSDEKNLSLISVGR